MHGYGIVLDFEGSLHDGFREVGYIRIKNFEIIEAKEITVGSGCKKNILRTFLENRYDFFLSHQSNIEKNFIKREMPYTTFSPSGKWEPWLDTKLIYKRLYPDLEKYDLRTLAETFLGLSSINEKAAIYCKPKKLGFHNALFDAFCCYALTKRLSTKVNLKKFLTPFA
tara:strand:- start:1335 stop:1838 length:504 start_codon:yes stop_codon:yes gene_type:complete